MNKAAKIFLAGLLLFAMLFQIPLYGCGSLADSDEVLISPLPEYTEPRMLQIGETQSLMDTFILYPEGSSAAFRFTSDDTSVLTVDQSGVVTAVGEGATLIRIKWPYHNGSAEHLVEFVVLPEGYGEEPDTSCHGYEYFTDSISWREANRRADELGGYLVNINSMEEFGELK